MFLFNQKNSLLPICFAEGACILVEDCASEFGIWNSGNVSGDFRVHLEQFCEDFYQLWSCSKGVLGSHLPSRRSTWYMNSLRKSSAPLVRNRKRVLDVRKWARAKTRRSENCISGYPKWVFWGLFSIGTGPKGPETSGKRLERCRNGPKRTQKDHLFGSKH